MTYASPRRLRTEHKPAEKLQPAPEKRLKELRYGPRAIAHAFSTLTDPGTVAFLEQAMITTYRPGVIVAMNLHTVAARPRQIRSQTIALPVVLGYTRRTPCGQRTIEEGAPTATGETPASPLRGSARRSLSRFAMPRQTRKFCRPASQPWLRREAGLGRQSGPSPLVAKPSTECLQHSCKHSGRVAACRDLELVLALDEPAVDLGVRVWLLCRWSSHRGSARN